MADERKKDKKSLRKRILIAAGIGAVVLAAAGVLLWADYWNLLPVRTYRVEDFGIETLYATVDYNHNGFDDYTDLLLGAKQDAVNRPDYNDAYFVGGYPPDEVGVCTDVIWRAFRYAGYCLKDMVDRDIAARPEAYPAIEEPDSNIDFRRVRNLHVFFDTYAISLTIDPEEISEWQAGDIVIFGADRHIGIVSDLRNRYGRPYIIHNGGQPKREEDYLARTSMPIIAHYRFDASLIDESILVPWD